MRPEKWDRISSSGKDFVKSLLQVTPEKRLTAAAALEHRWIAKRASKSHAEVDDSIVDALRQFGEASKFRRCCMEMMAWSLSNDERARVRQYFVSMDESKSGTITLVELKKVLEEKFSVPDDETMRIFGALDSNNDESIHYSDFLSAMVSTRIALHDNLLKAAFKKFDTDSSGYITVDNLREVLGETYDGEAVQDLLADADLMHDGRISYPEFVTYLRGDALPTHQSSAAELIDKQIMFASADSCKSVGSGLGVGSTDSSMFHQMKTKAKLVLKHPSGSFKRGSSGSHSPGKAYTGDNSTKESPDPWEAAVKKEESPPPKRPSTGKACCVIS
jgi:Ca2+-binding EF-hand superfamily protein